ncbi:MAG TPA: PAS domain-containing protein, partial [Vampirovibrionales bacterium]
MGNALNKFENIAKAINNLKVGIIVFKEGKLIEINNAAKELLEITEEQIAEGSLGEYKKSILDLLEINENGYLKQLTGIVGKPLEAYLHLNEECKIIELKESYETKLGEASHELKRPLTNVKTLVDTLHLWGAAEEPESRKKFLTQPHHEVGR